MGKDESCLEDLKKEYSEIQKKFGLPDFEKLNEDFSIEKLGENETDYLIREIRRFMSDKFSNYLRFFEAILNPVSAPMFVFSIIKAIGADEKKILEKVYKKLAKFEIELLSLDIEFGEEKEAKFVRESYEEWQKIKGDVSTVVKTVQKNWDNGFDVGANTKNYFG